MAKRRLQAAPWGLRVKSAILAIAGMTVVVAVLDAVLLADGASRGEWLGITRGGGGGTLLLLSLLIWLGGALLALLGAAWIEGPMKAALGRLRVAIEADAISAEAGVETVREGLQALGDEMRSLGTSLAQTTHSLQETAQALTPTSENLRNLHASLLTEATQQSKQAAAIQALSETMAATLNTVIQNAGDALKMANVAVENARQGGDVVNQTVKHMNAITITVANSAKIIRELGERSQGIGEIIRVIDDIADQTNLLALNAAIEAARAGEQGRGFAVVADEVRKLAERTTIATKEIAAMIRSIQAETNSAVAAMDEGIREVDKGAGLAVQAGVGLQKIVGGARNVAGMISKIAASSETQSSAAGDISGEIGRLSKTAEENLSRVEQAREAAEALFEGLARLAEVSRTLPGPGESPAPEGVSRVVDEANRMGRLNQELLRKFDIELPAM
ncbi:MAG: methyl-accepting chemotaxis protein [Planctomycetota bacterium]|jgi:methyl-accepting chemotaxis protein